MAASPPNSAIETTMESALKALRDLAEQDNPQFILIVLEPERLKHAWWLLADEHREWAIGALKRVQEVLDEEVNGGVATK